jgi:hypothetical protein
MMHNIQFKAASAIAVSALVILTTISAYANTSAKATVPHPQVAAELTEFKRTVFEMRREADTLHSFTRNHRMHWQSHTNRLHTLKQHVNKLGKHLAGLESLKPIASESQQMAIEQARPHLVAAAQNLTDAIEMVNANRRSVYDADYTEAVRSIQTHADSLHEKLGAILDHEKAKVRLDKLDLSSTSPEGS